MDIVSFSYFARSSFFVGPVSKQNCLSSLQSTLQIKLREFNNIARQPSDEYNLVLTAGSGDVLRIRKSST